MFMPFSPLYFSLDGPYNLAQGTALLPGIATKLIVQFLGTILT